MCSVLSWMTHVHPRISLVKFPKPIEIDKEMQHLVQQAPIARCLQRQAHVTTMRLPPGTSLQRRQRADAPRSHRVCASSAGDALPFKYVQLPRRRSGAHWPGGAGGGRRRGFWVRGLGAPGTALAEAGRTPGGGAE